MKCKACGKELQKVPILGNTKEYMWYCGQCQENGNVCFSKETFKMESSWRSGLNGKKEGAI